ncbi:MAG: hypothetical protein H6608_07300 [Flavobacteriales bacterium]|nr:hypothetical protein [Bacteroidota bacterium]MCB9240919.1 hypothetical protein [Flavobacteriales bacterium]
MLRFVLIGWLVVGMLSPLDLAAAEVVDGRADLTQELSTGKQTTFLNGEWKFTWNQFVSPDSFYADADNLKVPGSWAKYTGYNDIFPRHLGYGSYQIDLKLPPNIRDWTIKIPIIHSAYDLFVNGQKIHSRGRTDTTGHSDPEVQSDLVIIQPDQAGHALITLHVSNSTFPMGGIQSAVAVGGVQPMMLHQLRIMLMSAFIVGILVIMGIYHIGIFLFRRKDKGPLYFAVMCLAFALRELLGQETLMWKIYDGFPYELGVRMLYVTLGFLFIIFLKFIDNIFPNQFKPWFIRLVLYVSIILTLSAIFLPPTIFARYNLITLPVLFTAHIWTIVILIRGIIQKKPGSALFLFGVVVIIISSLNDIFNQVGTLNSGYIYPLGFAIFIFCQSLVLAIRFSNSFDQVENLNLELEGVAEAQSRFVPTEFLNLLGKSKITEISLDDNREMNMGIFFADLRNFSMMAENWTADETFRQVNTVLRKAAPLIRKNHGFIDKYIGDAIMALFHEKPQYMVHAAMAIKRSINDTEGPFRFGIGLHYGDMILGMVGEEKRMEATVISDVVNVASRVEQLTKTYHVNIILTEELYGQLDHSEIECRFLDETWVKGISHPIRIYELIDHDTPHGKKTLQYREEYEDAVHMKLRGEREAAKSAFESYTTNFPEDRSVEVHLTNLARIPEDDDATSAPDNQ